MKSTPTAIPQCLKFWIWRKSALGFISWTWPAEPAACFRLICSGVRRAGLDYWHLVDVRVYDNLEEFFRINQVEQMWCLSTKAMEAAGSTETITIETVHMTMLVHGIDNVESIEIPQEALDAAA